MAVSMEKFNFSSFQNIDNIFVKPPNTVRFPTYTPKVASPSSMAVAISAPYNYGTFLCQECPCGKLCLTTSVADHFFTDHIEEIYSSTLLRIEFHLGSLQAIGGKKVIFQYVDNVFYAFTVEYKNKYLRLVPKYMPNTNNVIVQSFAAVVVDMWARDNNLIKEYYDGIVYRHHDVSNLHSTDKALESEFVIEMRNNFKTDDLMIKIAYLIK
uniref:Uncharacterized protein n=1 Tax=Clastoptera arizonana TaxID=38151 RepID=A0A1B6CKM0_9HEMI